MILAAPVVAEQLTQQMRTRRNLQLELTRVGLVVS